MRPGRIRATKAAHLVYLVHLGRSGGEQQAGDGRVGGQNIGHTGLFPKAAVLATWLWSPKFGPRW